MKYLKLFERFSTFEHDFGQFKIEVVDANPNNYDGGIQVDSATITCDGKEYFFELHTPVGGLGEVHVKYLGGDDEEFISHFGLEEDTFIDESELSEFLQVNSPDCVGYDTEIDGYEMEITDFNHDGGMEIGTIETTINGEEIQFEMIQDATTGFGFGVEFDSDEDEEKANKIGFELTDEIREYLFNEYDRICAEKR
jgi:hypothetical protein